MPIANTASITDAVKEFQDLDRPLAAQTAGIAEGGRAHGAGTGRQMFVQLRFSGQSAHQLRQLGQRRLVIKQVVHHLADLPCLGKFT